MNALKRASYHPVVIRTFRVLGLRHIARNLYYRWARPRDGVLRIEVGGVDAKFYVRTPGELRVVDPAGETQGERHILEHLMATLRAGDVFYDIGANVGLYTVLLAKTLGDQGQVIAFEPGREAYQHLQDNLTLNHLSNVRTFRKALGERAGEAELYTGDENGHSSLLRHPSGTDLGTEAVEVAVGDQFIGTEHLPLPRAVKIDVEGYEYAVLTGLRSTLAQPVCELVCCELHPTLLPPGVTPQRILELLESLGFRTTDVRSRNETYHAVCWKA